MQHTHDNHWDRHAILAEIKRRYGSLRALAALSHVSAAEMSAALGSPYPKAERVIAAALDRPVQDLWPDRYWPNGRRRSANSRPQCEGASQNGPLHVDKGGAR